MQRRYSRASCVKNTHDCVLSVVHCDPSSQCSSDDTSKLHLLLIRSTLQLRSLHTRSVSRLNADWIEPATFRVVALCLSQLRYRVVIIQSIKKRNVCAPCANVCMHSFSGDKSILLSACQAGIYYSGKMWKSMRSSTNRLASSETNVTTYYTIIIYTVI